MARVFRWLLGILAVLVAALCGSVYWCGRPAQPSPAQYVAMGSSFASGPLITHRAPHSPWFCLQSDDNYAHQLARRRGLSLVDVSCAGARTVNVLGPGALLQPPQLDALRPETELVTLTIGGNDIAYLGNLMAMGCHQSGHGVRAVLRGLLTCKLLPRDQVQARLQALPAQLDRIAAEVHRRSPRAKLILLTYQTVLPPSGSCDALGLSEAQADEMRGVAAALADVVRAAAQRNALLFDAAAATEGHDVCAADAWIGDRQAGVPLHPKLAGMTAVAQGLNRLLDSGDQAQ